MKAEDGTDTGRVLIVEDSAAIGALLRHAVEALGFEVDLARSLAEARRTLDEAPGAHHIAVTDLDLPDAPDGEAIDLALGRGLTVVVLTGSGDDATRERIMAKPIVDYVVKRDPSAIEYAAGLVRRLHRNAGATALVVDDSESQRAFVAAMLARQRFRVLTAPDGETAVRLAEQEPSVRLVLTDYEMPGLDGLALTSRLRAKRPYSETCIIGMTASGQPRIAQRFLKHGANDILAKPLNSEELFVRVNNQLNLLDYMAEAREQALRDPLTGLHNRRYLAETAPALVASATRGHIELAVAALDIDHFKRVNDTHGHDAGDAVLRAVGGALGRALRRTDLVARIGGEEFCVVAVNPGDPAVLFDRLRGTIAGLEIALPDGGLLKVTASFGVTRADGVPLETLLKRADLALYAAKGGGRNCVKVFEPELVAAA